MNLWELRQLIETSIPWYGPIIFGILFFCCYVIYLTLGERVSLMICQRRKNRAYRRRIAQLKADIQYIDQNSRLTDETKAKIRLRILKQIRLLEGKVLE